MRAYRYRLSRGVSPGATNMTVWYSTNGSDAKMPTSSDAFIAVPMNSVRSI